MGVGGIGRRRDRKGGRTEIERERRAGGRGRDGERVRGERDEGEMKGWRGRVRERGRREEGVETERERDTEDNVERR